MAAIRCIYHLFLSLIFLIILTNSLATNELDTSTDSLVHSDADIPQDAENDYNGDILTAKRPDHQELSQVEDESSKESDFHEMNHMESTIQAELFIQVESSPVDIESVHRDEPTPMETGNEYENTDNREREPPRGVYTFERVEDYHGSLTHEFVEKSYKDQNIDLHVQDIHIHQEEIPAEDKKERDLHIHIQDIHIHGHGQGIDTNELLQHVSNVNTHSHTKDIQVDRLSEQDLHIHVEDIRIRGHGQNADKHSHVQDTHVFVHQAGDESNHPEAEPTVAEENYDQPTSYIPQTDNEDLMQDISMTSGVTANDDSVDYVDDIIHEDETINEILSILQEEEQERLQQELDALKDAERAKEAENMAKEQERLELQRERERQREAMREAQARDAAAATPLRESAASGLGSAKANRGFSSNANAEKSQPKSPSSASPKVGLGGIGVTKGLESLFSKLPNQENTKSTSRRSPEDLARFKRYQYPRIYSRPVERIIEYYEDDSKNLYDIFALKVPRSLKAAKSRAMSSKSSKSDIENIFAEFDEKGLKQTYRTMAIQLHPDKNPHPDAKYAFDILQDAYETLLTPSSRREYNDLLRRQYQKKKMTIKKIKKRLSDEIINFKARFLLFAHRIRHGQIKEEVHDLLESPKAKLTGILHKLQHISLLPSVYDRIVYLHEMIWTHRKMIFMMLVMGTMRWEEKLYDMSSIVTGYASSIFSH